MKFCILILILYFNYILTCSFAAAEILLLSRVYYSFNHFSLVLSQLTSNMQTKVKEVNFGCVLLNGS